MPNREEQTEFRSALARLRAEQRRYAARGALSILGAAALAAFSILLTVQFRFPEWRMFPLLAYILFWGMVAAGASIAVLRVLLPIRGERSLAAGLDRRSGSGNLITAAYEFSRGGERIRAYSSFLIGATIRRAAEKLRGLDPRSLFSESGAPAWTAAGILLGILVVIQVAFLHGEPGAIVTAITDPRLSFRAPHRYNLVVTSGNRFVLPGERVTAEAVNYGSVRGDAELLVSSIPGVWNKIKVRGEAIGSGDVRLSMYRHLFNDVWDDFSYSFSAGGSRTPAYRVTVMHRPIVNQLTAVVRYPAYTRAKADTIEPLAGKIVALSGSTVELAGETSVPIRGGTLRLASGAALPVRPRAGGFTGSFRVASDDTFVVEIVDSMGLGNERGVKYPVIALEDRPPAIELLAPEDRAQLPRTLATELLYRASDDYGIARLDLEFMREGKDEKFKRIPLPIAGPEGRSAAGGAEGTPGGAEGGGAAGGPTGGASSAPGGPVTELAGRSAWSLAELGVFPGDRILYYLEVFDNNVITGPGRARTETRTLLVPSAAEIYARIREEESKQRENLEEVLDKGKEIKERLKKLSDELKAEGNLDWSRRRESGEILERQRELREKMREITSQIDKGLDDIERNRTASREIGEKIEQIQSLLKQIENEDLRNLMENFRKLMSEISSKELMAAMNDIQLDAEKLIQNMDRTIELLKQVIKEEKMDEFVKRLDEILKEQAAIRDSTSRGDTDELSKKQEALGKESSSYEKDMDRFAKEESDSSLSSELEKLLDEMRKKEIEKQMQKSAEELSSGDRSGAQCSQSQTMQDLLSLYTTLGRCQSSMGMALEQEVIEQLARSARELVEVSKLQETLGPRLREPFGRSDSEGLIKDELVVKDALQKITDNLYETARKTLLVSRKVFIALGAAQANVEAVLKSIQSEQGGAAAGAAAAYRSINLSIIELLRASVSSGGSRMGGRQMMQQLMEQQLSLSEELNRLLQSRGAGQWSMEQRAAMARLAGEQRKMEELVKQIAEESGGTGELMGKLDDVTKQMEQMAKELEEGTLDEEVLERQERILTRMLDSQRSMRERDYKKERTSTTAGDVKALGPEGWNEGADRSEVLLKMIRRAMQEKGPAEYEELIRQYFRALSEKAREVK